ncbi:MAG: hypothetical protein WCG07_00785 [Candidatus Taylorbacteria bacterium]
MLYVFHGTDIQKSVTKAHTLIDSLRTKRPDATFVTVEAKDWSPSVIEEHIGGQGLFSNKYIVFLDRVSEHADAQDMLTEYIPALKESTNIFIVLENKTPAELKKKFEAHADKVVVTDEPAKAGWGNSGEFNVFALADAVGERNSFKAWSVYREAIGAGLEVESIIGTLFWQVKSMILALNGKSAADTGLTPFVYSKAKKACGNYSRDELYALLENLILIYHDSHRGLVDGELAVEQVCLGLKKGE